MGNIKKPIIELVFDDDEEIKEYQILKKFKSHNILNERLDLYRDFTINLLYKIYDTYLGIEYIDSMEKANGHYNWCFEKILHEFNEQEINFYHNDLLYDYFFDFYLTKFYKLEKQPKFSEMKNFWLNIFDYKKLNKTKKEFDVLIELYEIFDISMVINDKELITN
mgnify:CR=1 FL=1